jgi:3-oxoacyl-[acyl-carrier-protein] synthase III
VVPPPRGSTETRQRRIVDAEAAVVRRIFSKYANCSSASTPIALDAVRNEHTATGRLLKAAYFQKLNPVVWDMVWDAATVAYPPNLVFPRAA